MNIAQQRQANELVLSALEKPPSERAALVARACGGDDELRREVKSLLAAADSGLVDLEPVFGLLAERRSALAVGERIGSYRVLRRLGEGGMGAVYLAEPDGGAGTRAAVKVLRPGMETASGRRRFDAEHRILATLDHPHIARLFEKGTTADGRPYFAMEYVEGEPIDRYCRCRALMVRERLELFDKVCSAVELAHRRHVIHRDLKPSNILVTAAGEPKLLDFGIAKLLDNRDGEALTLTEVRPMTPSYASPEQAGYGPVTLASDVYSLGILLYELLRGHRVQGLGRRGDPEIRQELCRHLGRGLGGVVATALRRDPEERYASVALFSEDLRCHREGRSTSAGRRRLVRRLRRGLPLPRCTWEVALVVTAFVLAFVLAGFHADRSPPDVPGAAPPLMTWPFRPANSDIEAGTAEEFSSIPGWWPNGAWAYHASFPAEGRDGLGERFGYYSAGLDETVGQFLPRSFEPEATYVFKSRALGGRDRRGRIPYQIGYVSAVGELGPFVPLATHVVDLDSRAAWEKTEGVRYTTGTAGPEIGRQIVVRFGGRADGGASDVWFDDVVLMREPSSEASP